MTKNVVTAAGVFICMTNLRCQSRIASVVRLVPAGAATVFVVAAAAVIAVVVVTLW